MRIWHALAITILVLVVSVIGFVWALTQILNRLGYGDLLVPILVLFVCLGALSETKIHFKGTLDD
jgi:membrane protein required for beta-lactamase induction